ncbi:6,7-dimethyl-8-ribityllumazine synthase [bacterium SM23_31]|nr:MAG: 6,7-dimethyl-8-ribityllumazine synthase [bacterium SM23_31]
MVKIHKGKISGKGIKAGIIVSRFNEIVTNKLLTGALDCLEQHHTESSDIEVFWVPGSFEIPKIAKIVAETGSFDGVLCLGAVIRGDTPHFDYIAAEVTKGIAQVNLQVKIPVIYGVLTTDTVEQALDRAGAKIGNKGWDAAETMLEVIDLQKNLNVHK